MDNLQIFQKATTLLESQERIALATVINTIGSTPGKTGYKMLIWAGGQKTFGTVGGGYVEAMIIERAGNMLSESCSRTFRFKLGESPDDEKGICGGEIEFLVETFDKGALNLFNELVLVTSDDENAVLLSFVTKNELPRKIIIRDGAIPQGLEISSDVLSVVKEVTAGGRDAVRISADDVEAFIESITPPPMVIIFGAGHVSQYVAGYAKEVHFRVCVFDDRSEYANRKLFPGVDKIIVGDFSDVIDKVDINSTCYIVILTRGHKCDEIVLKQAVITDARYIGMIGSKRKTHAILEKLRKDGVPPEAFERIFSPIGISIGAVTPEEIALSIVCELVKIRRMGALAQIEHKTLNRLEFDK